jgi:predicted nucleotidyltransferase
MLLRNKDRQKIVSLAKKIDLPIKLWAYGSRVSKNAHDTSDLDLVMISQTKNKIDTDKFLSFKEDLQNSNIPIFVQVVDWHRVSPIFHENILENYEVLFETI